MSERAAKKQKTTSNDDESKGSIVKMTAEAVYRAKKHLLYLQYSLQFDKDILTQDAAASLQKKVDELTRVITRWTEEDQELKDLAKDIADLEQTLEADGDIMEAADRKELVEDIEKKKAKQQRLMIARLDEEGKQEYKKEVRAKINALLSEEKEEIVKQSEILRNLLEMDSELLNEEEREKLQEELKSQESQVDDLDAQITEQERKQARRDALVKDIKNIEDTAAFDGDIADEGDLDRELTNAESELAGIKD